MAEIVFARPRHEYDSYRDLWRLVQLSGFKLIYIDEINPDDTGSIYIFSSPDASLQWEGAKAKIISWLIEWYEDYTLKPGVSEAWHPDATFAKKIGARYIPLGSDPRLGDRPDKIKSYDVIHLQYLNGRRRPIVDRLSDRGLKVADNCWGALRDERLKSSRMMLHIHQHDTVPAVAPLRAALAAAYRLPLVSERAWEVPHIAAGIIRQYDYGDLVERVSGLNGGLQGEADALHSALCYDFNFEKVVRASV